MKTDTDAVTETQPASEAYLRCGEDRYPFTAHCSFQVLCLCVCVRVFVCVDVCSNVFVGGRRADSLRSRSHSVSLSLSLSFSFTHTRSGDMKLAEELAAVIFALAPSTTRNQQVSSLISFVFDDCCVLVVPGGAVCGRAAQISPRTTDRGT